MKGVASNARLSITALMALRSSTNLVEPVVAMPMPWPVQLYTHCTRSATINPVFHSKFDSDLGNFQLEIQIEFGLSKDLGNKLVSSSTNQKTL